MDTAPTVYGHFNARFATIESLVDIFIPSDKFEVVARPAHTVVLGPRGSGKTCLLKMLQPGALSKWNSGRATALKSQIGYIGVYIPTDISWSQQAEHLGKPGLRGEYQLRLQHAAFTAQVLQRLIDTVLDCLELKETAPWACLELSYEKEAELAKELASHWKLSLTTHTLSSVKQKLAGRVGDIWRFGRQETLADDAGRAERFINNNDLSFDFIEETLYGITLINDFSGRKGRQWALLFDELEIAPTWLIDRLFPQLRSTNQNVFLKLSMSPFAKISQANTPSSPRPGHDYEPVPLWNANKTEATPFSRELLQRTLERKKIVDVDLYKMFGHSPLKPSTTDKYRGYAPGSTSYKALKTAYNNDPGFREYIDRRGIDLEKLAELPEDKRAADIRKPYPLILFRNEFRKFQRSADSVAVYRSAKKPKIFTGIDSFLEILEGNPRWIVGAADELAQEIVKRGKIGPSQQYNYLKETAERFMSLLKTIPLYDNAREQRSLGDTLDSVGDRIYASVVQDYFTTEPYGSFRIDANCGDDLLESIGIAMNAGAIILLSDVETNWLVASELREKEFRLSYLLSPYKHIPFRKGRSFPLSEILGQVSARRQKPRNGLSETERSATGELDLGL